MSEPFEDAPVKEVQEGLPVVNTDTFTSIFEVDQLFDYYIIDLLRPTAYATIQTLPTPPR